MPADLPFWLTDGYFRAKIQFNFNVHFKLLSFQRNTIKKIVVYRKHCNLYETWPAGLNTKQRKWQQELSSERDKGDNKSLLQRNLLPFYGLAFNNVISK